MDGHSRPLERKILLNGPIYVEGQNRAFSPHLDEKDKFSTQIVGFYEAWKPNPRVFPISLQWFLVSTPGSNRLRQRISL